MDEFNFISPEAYEKLFSSKLNTGDLFKYCQALPDEYLLFKEKNGEYIQFKKEFPFEAKKVTLIRIKQVFNKKEFHMWVDTSIIPILIERRDKGELTFKEVCSKTVLVLKS